MPIADGLPGRRSELVFAYLAAEHRRDVSRGELADALWPNELPQAWAAALRGVISEVRRVMATAGLDAAELLESTGDGYRLRLPPGTTVDLDDVRAALSEARALSAGDAAAAARNAARAAELARLPFLPQHEGDWVDGVRRELESMLVEALELAARSHARAGDPRAANAAAARLVAAEPYSEAAHRLRIELLAAAGDRGGAARAYEESRAALAELGIEPSAATRDALERAPAPRADTRGAQSASAPPLAALSVLVVDDHDFQRRTAIALLGRLGVRVLAEARDGSEALDLLARASRPPDVIVCDIDMPGMDGVEFIRHVAERRLASAVLVASGLDRSVVNAVEAVAQGYGLQVLGAVEKPLTARRLSDLLGAYRPGSRAREDAGPPPATESELLAALEEGAIGARFVPIVDLQLGAVSGAAAIAGWDDEADERPLPPAEHLGAALGARLTDRVLAAACDEFHELARDGIEVPLWIAAPPQALRDVGRADRLLAIVREQRAEPSRFVFAFGERAVRRSTPAELEVLTRLRVKGFGVCLDDFRGGHASDDALARIPLTAVALAPALVRGAAGDPGRAADLEDALDAIGARGLPAIARGCDDAADYELLLQLGCPHAEGSFIAGALPGGQLAGWARGWSAPSIAGGSP